MDKQELEILIDKSILGTLTPTEKSKLEAHIMKQPNTKLEIKMRTDIMKGFEFNEVQDLRKVLDKIHREEISGAKGNFLLKRIGLIVLCVGIAIGAYSLYSMLNKTENSTISNNTVLYASYYQTYTPSIETRSSDNIQDDVYQEFIAAYREGNYQKSLETINPLLVDADNQTLLMAGISAIEIGKTEESLQYINKIIESNDYYFADHANWYKALILLKTNKINQAKMLLTELANTPKADHHDEAVSLLKEF